MIRRLFSWLRARRDAHRFGRLGAKLLAPPILTRADPYGMRYLERQVEELISAQELRRNEADRAQLDGPCVSCGRAGPYPSACPHTRDGSHHYAPRGTEWAGRQGKEP